MRSKSRQPLDRFIQMLRHSKCRRSTRHQISVSRTFQSGARQVDWHTVPERLLTVRLDGSAEYQTSDGDERRVPAGSFVCLKTLMARDTNRYIRRKNRQCFWISLPLGLREPLTLNCKNRRSSLTRLYDRSWPVSSDIVAQANVGVQGNNGRARGKPHIPRESYCP